MNVSVRGGGAVDEVEGNIPADVSVRGGGGLIPLEDKWKEISQQTYPSEGVVV